MGEEAYLGKGQRQSYFIETDEREVLIELYKLYDAYLDNENIVDINVKKISSDYKCDYLIIDEGQNLQPIAYRTYVKLRKQ